MNRQFGPAVALIVEKAPSVAGEALKIMHSSSPLLRLRSITPTALEEGNWTREERLVLWKALAWDADENDE